MIDCTVEQFVTVNKRDNAENENNWSFQASYLKHVKRVASNVQNLRKVYIAIALPQPFIKTKTINRVEVVAIVLRAAGWSKQ